MLEVLLAYLHITAILTMTVFLSSEAALCRQDWMNAATIRRLARVDLIYGIGALLVLLSGLARLIWGLKGWEWYVQNPLFHIKMTLFVLMLLLSLRPTLAMRRWLHAVNTDGSLPAPAAVQSVRRQIMVSAHLMLLLPLFGVLLARGMRW